MKLFADKSIIDYLLIPNITGETIMSLFVILLIIILAIIINITFKKLDPTKPIKGFAFLISSFVEWLDNFVNDLMGKKWDGFAGYIMPLVLYIAFSFLIGVTGLPGPMTLTSNTFTIGLCTFLWIHITAIKANKWGYFKRYIEPIPVLLPINLLSMWAPFLSLSLRIFGNAVSGLTLMAVIYSALAGVGEWLFGWIGGGVGQLLIAPLITPVFHAYFDLFSGAIQTLIFTMLTCILVSLEDPDPEKM